MGQFVELAEVVVNVFVRAHGQGLVDRVEGGDDTLGAVEHAVSALVVVIADLVTLSPMRKIRPPKRRSGTSGLAGVSASCRKVVKHTGSGSTAMHRDQHLNIAPGVQAELGRDASGNYINGELGVLFGVVDVEVEKVAHLWLRG